MTKREQILNLLKAQDIIRQVYINQTCPKIENVFKSLDKVLSELINIIGGK